MRRMVALGSVTLCIRSTFIFQVLEAAVNSSSAIWPLGNRQRLSGRRKGAAKPSRSPKRSECSGADDIGGEGGDLLDSLGVDGDGSPGRARYFPQESGFALVALDQVDFARRRGWRGRGRGSRRRCRNPPGRWARRRDQRQKLRRVGEVAVPQVIDRAGADKIDRALPLAQQVRIGVQALTCFT